MSFKSSILIFFYISKLLYPQIEDSGYKPIQLFSKDILRKYLNVLGNDSLQGRGTGSVGLEKTAKFIANKFSEYGLKPLSDANSYFQYIPMHGSLPLSKSELKIIYRDESISLVLNKDYLLYTSGEQTFLPSSAQLVFVGYGISAPEYDYNDYQQINVQGKIAVFIDGEPYSDDDRYFSGHAPTIYSLPEAKQRIALSRGAVGSILIPFEINYSDEKWKKTINDFSFENVTLASSVNKNLSILINPESARILFQNSIFDLDDIIKMHEENNMQSFHLSCELSFNGFFKERDFLSTNVIGLLEGNDDQLKDSYIIISAHYDHLGVGIEINGDSVYNGVLDNAIGVSGLLELVRTFGYLKSNLKRSILFICLTAEEKGLLGSQYYVSSPMVPLYKSIANLNIDGLGSYDEFNSVIGIGSEYSSLNEFLLEAAQRRELSVTNIPNQFENWISFYKSDQASFAQAGIPSILIYEGIDPKYKSKDEALEWFINYSNNIYHSPFDDLSQEINLNATIQHLTILYDFITLLSNSDVIPKWNDDSPFLQARLRSIAEKR